MATRTKTTTVAKDETTPPFTKVVTTILPAANLGWMFLDTLNPAAIPVGGMEVLCFFAQMWHLAYFDCPFFTDPIYATERAIVIPSIEYFFRSLSIAELSMAANQQLTIASPQLIIMEGVKRQLNGMDRQQVETIIRSSGIWQEARRRQHPEVFEHPAIDLNYATRYMRKHLSDFPLHQHVAKIVANHQREVLATQP